MNIVILCNLIYLRIYGYTIKFHPYFIRSLFLKASKAWKENFYSVFDSLSFSLSLSLFDILPYCY